MQSSSNSSTTTSNFWSDGGYRKRKIAASDLEEKSQNKIFLTEEKLLQNMKTLSLDVSINNNNTSINQILEEDEKNQINETRFELHKLLKDNLKRDDLHDDLINKLCKLERKKFSMQIVPYMPIHPAQLNNNNNHIKTDEKKKKIESSSSVTINQVKQQNDDHIFKRPFSPVPYTVEEPSENTNKRISRMKRSYSQSLRSNSNLSVIELKTDTIDYLFYPSNSDYFIVEPSTPVLNESSTKSSNSSSLSSSIQITECFDFYSSSLLNNMQSIISSDINNKMDDDI